MRFLFALTLSILSGSTLLAQSRQLDWPSVTVDAHLDADGRLHVSERQVMRFTGDWNGGQRLFDLRPGQKLSFDGLTRIDPVTGIEQPMTEGDVDAVDHFEFADRSTLRWRSRQPQDPVFDRTELTYLLRYSYDNILAPLDDGSYLLDHDFGFPDREGAIGRFEVRLLIDPAWKPATPVQELYSGTDLPPGVSFTITIPLSYQGTGLPASVLRGAEPDTRLLLNVLLLSTVLVLLVRLHSRERRIGRFAPLTPRHEITPAWLDAHVFSRLPEVVGAAWDDHTASPEVAATLARLVQEKKLSSEVKSTEGFFRSKSVLHLEIKVDRKQFQEHELALINALFRGVETTTDTDRVRERYSKTGFNPATLIKSRLERLVELTTPGPKGENPSPLVSRLLLAGAVACLVVGLSSRSSDLPAAIKVVGISIPLYLIAVGFATAWQRRVRGFVIIPLLGSIPLGVIIYFVSWALLARGDGRVGGLVLAGLTLWALTLTNSVLNAARSRHSVERIAVRKRLTAARDFFREQLARSEPQLKDEWFPYLIAFGLGGHIDKWFRSFGGAASTGAAMATARSMGSGSTGGGSGGSWTGFGGGGGFSGGGASAAFAAAVGGMAASVPAPSSGGSGGGGGGGGGGSSGGGGGGGW